MANTLIDFLELPLSTRPTFTVDSTVNEVAIAQPAAAYFQNSEAKTKFAQADNILILGLGIRLPYCYGMSTEPGILSLKWNDPLAVALDGPFYNQYISLANEEISLAGSGADGYFARYYSGVNAANARLLVALSNLKVSMVNNPFSIADGTVLSIGVFAKVQHLITMSL